MNNTSGKSNLASRAKTSLLMLFACSTMYGQKFSENIPYNFRNRFSIGLTTFSANSLQISSENDRLLKSSRAFSGELSVLYDVYLFKKLYITVGAGIGVLPFNLSFEIPSEQIIGLESASIDLNFFSYDLYYANFPILLNYEAFSRERITWAISAGASYSRMYNPDYRIGVGLSVYDEQSLETFELFQFDLFEAEDHHHFNLILGVSASLETVKGRRWMFALISQFGSMVGQGNYQFLNVKDPSQGTVELGFNWIGLRTSYGFKTKKDKVIQASRRR